MRKYITVLFLIAFLSVFCLTAQSVKTYDNGLLKTEERDDGTRIVYTYLNGRLLFTTETDPEGNSTVEYYLRSPVDYSLIAVKRGGELKSFSDEELPYRGDFTEDDEKNIVYEEDGTLYTYTPAGLLLKEDREGVVREYSYDGSGALTKSVTRTDNTVREEVFEGGKLSSYTIYENNQIKESGEYSPQGLVKTIYNRSKAVARITYGKDLIKVLSIEYL
ncbi:MAG: hypothetical protein K5634_04595 [Sphaerochaetaceae bacterium]|nr:hypothetical protein [Sphaerochaetaceae bacterium]